MEDQSVQTSRPKWPKLLLAVSGVYACWLLWLAYLAWVNVQAGNQ